MNNPVLAALCVGVILGIVHLLTRSAYRRGYSDGAEDAHKGWTNVIKREIDKLRVEKVTK